MEQSTSHIFIGTAKEKFNCHNTLLCLIKALQGKNITLDLRNDSYVCGLITSVDGYMNITFAKSVYCDPQGNEFLYDQLFIRARNIRYIHIPENMPIVKTINGQLHENKRRLPDKNPVVQSRKASKALKQHMQIVASLHNK